MSHINIDGVDASELGFIQKDLVEKFKIYMENPLEFTSIHIGLTNYSNCVLFFDKPIDEALLSTLPTDYRKILFSSIYNFKLFNTDNIAIINKNILDEMMDDKETAYDKLFDPELLKKPVRKGNKIGGNKNGNMAKYKKSNRSWK